MTEVAKHAFTMKSIDDAMKLRNHVINTLEQADVESENEQHIITSVCLARSSIDLSTV